jgi:hypothetical protein
MKKILICLFLVSSLASFSQDKEKTKDFFWGKSDDYKTVYTTPEKWKNESAVIIYKFEFFDYHKFGKSVNYTSAIRKRIKLQDAAAVKEFSEFSFNDKFYSNKGFSYKKGTNIIGVKVVKPNGKELEIDVDKESKKLDNEKKIAIANLEVGDIIDYYYYSEEPFKSSLEVGFDPVETTLGDIYPTMNIKIKFHTENDFFVNFNTYNGAPELKEIPTNDSGEREYELNAKDLEKNDFPRWFYPLVEMPCYKFQVFFARSGKFEARADAFLSEKERDIKKTVTKDDIFNYYNDKFRPMGDLEHINKFLKGKTFANDEEKVREVYYFTRHQYFTQYIEASVIKEANIFYPYDLYENPVFLGSEQAFIDHFMSFLKKNDIDYDIIVGTSRYNGAIEDLLIQKNVNVLLRVNTKNPIYLQYFSPFSSADQFNYNLENTKAFALQISKGKKIVDAESAVLPSSTMKDNVSKIISNVSFSDDFSGLKVKRESSYFGHFKESYQSDKLNFYDYVNEDYTKYGTEPIIDKVRNKKKQEQYRNEFTALINKSKEKQKEGYKKDIADDFGFEVDDVVFTVKNTGRFGKNVPLIFEEDFVIKNNLIKKAGENYIIEIGKLITGQVEIEKKEIDRKNNIYIAFPKAFENEIVFDIPSGYTVSGLDKLNKKVENETGEFSSNASISGNKLTIKTTKQYKNYYEPNKNWSKMILFLDAAYQFTQEKILLKKS